MKKKLLLAFIILISSQIMKAQCSSPTILMQNGTGIFAGSCLLEVTGFPPNISVQFVQTAPTLAVIGTTTTNSTGKGFYILPGTCPTTIVAFQASGGGCIASFTNVPANIKSNSIMFNKTTTGNKISWVSEGELLGSSYELMKSTNGTDFVLTGIKQNVTTVSNGITRFLIDPNNTTNCYYRVQVKQATGMSSYSNIIKAVVDGNASVSVYPNPVKENAILNVPSTYINTTYTILNLEGKTISKALITANSQQIDFSKITKGLYVIRLNNNTESVNIKLNKQ